MAVVDAADKLWFRHCQEYEDKTVQLPAKKVGPGGLANPLVAPLYEAITFVSQ